MPHRRDNSVQLAMVLLGILCVVALICILIGKKAMLVLLGTLGVIGGVTLIAWPNLPTYVVIFVLYTNAAVVAVRFHGVPMIVGAATPLLLGIPLVYYIILRRQKVFLDPVVPLVFLFLVVNLFSSLFSRNPRISMSEVTNIAIEGLALYFLILNVVRTPQILRRAVWVLIAAGAFMGGLSTLQQATGTYRNNYGGFAQMSNAEFETGEAATHGAVHQRRLAGPIGAQNRYAQIMLMVLPLALFTFLTARKKILRVAAGGGTLLIAFGMVLAFSRGAAVAFVIMLAVMVVFRYITLLQFGLVLAGIAVVGLAVPAYAARLSTLTGLKLGTDAQSVRGAGSAVRGRFTEGMAAAAMFADHIWTGVGPGMYPKYYHEYGREVGGKIKESTRQPHTLYLGIAAELGLPGLLAHLALVFVLLRNLARTRRECRESNPDMANIATAMFLSMVAYLASSLFLHLAFIRYFWLIAALCGATAYLARTTLASTMRTAPA